jgi:hypothetical protein
MPSLLRTLIALSLLTGMLVFEQCKCKPETVEPVPCTASNSVLIPADMKDRFYFKDGTYWVYQNINTGATDSMWVWKSELTVLPVDPKIYGSGFNKCYESFGYYIRNAKSVLDDSYYSSMGIILHPQKQESAKELFGISDFYHLNHSDINSYRIENRGGVYENQIGATMEMKDSIMTQDNTVFKDILRLYYAVGAQTNDYLTDMCFAKNIGLAKFKRRTDNTEWELTRYRIVQ